MPFSPILYEPARLFVNFETNYRNVHNLRDTYVALEYVSGFVGETTPTREVKMMKARPSPILPGRCISLALAIFAFVALFAAQAKPAAAGNPSHVRVIQASPDIAIV